MCHLFDEVVEFAADAGQVGKAAVPQAMPVGAVLRQRSAAARFVNCDAEREDVGLGQVRVILLQNLVRQVSAVAFLHARVIHGRHMAEIADLVSDRLVVVQLVVVLVESVVAVRLPRERLCDEDVARLDVHVDEPVRVDVLQSLGDVQEQNLQLRLVQESLLQQRLQTAAVAVLVLDQHVVVLRPRRVVADDVVVLAQHRVSVHLVERRLLEGAAGDRLDAPLDGVDAAVQPVQALIDQAELALAQQLQLHKLLLVSRNVRLLQSQTLGRLSELVQFLIIAQLE